MVAPEARWQALLPVLRPWPLAVAFSGGLDSRFLCFSLRRAGCDVLALHATGPHVPQAESAAARRWARAQGLPLLEVRHDPLSLPEVAVNSRERCYACKRALMRRLRDALSAAGGCRILCDGSNADDLTAFRPGQRAVREAGVLSPLALAGLRKQELRDLGASWGLDDPQQAARPCLLTRLAYGMHPEPALLARLAAAETDLAALPGLGDFRLRLTPEPVLQAAVLPDGLRPQVRQVLDAHGFGGAGMVEGTVSGFFDRRDDVFLRGSPFLLPMPVAFCVATGTASWSRSLPVYEGLPRRPDKGGGYFPRKQ